MTANWNRSLVFINYTNTLRGQRFPPKCNYATAGQVIQAKNACLFCSHLAGLCPSEFGPPKLLTHACSFELKAGFSSVVRRQTSFVHPYFMDITACTPALSRFRHGQPPGPGGFHHSTTPVLHFAALLRATSPTIRIPRPSAAAPPTCASLRWIAPLCTIRATVDPDLRLGT